jgi:hypothetical protein
VADEKLLGKHILVIEDEPLLAQRSGRPLKATSVSAQALQKCVTGAVKIMKMGR